MIYQVRANFFFDIEDEALDFFQDCEIAFPRTVSINPGSENSEFSIVELINNYHDQDPNAPCDLITSITTEPPPPD